MIIKISGSTPTNVFVTGSGVPGNSGISVSVPQFVTLATRAVTSSYAIIAESILELPDSSSYAEFAASAGFASSSWNVLNNIPENLISSSIQVDYNNIQNQPTSVLSATFAEIASIANLVEFEDIANLPTLISSSQQVTYTQLSNIPANIVSSSTQAVSWSVASSSVAVSSSFAVSASWAPGGNSDASLFASTSLSSSWASSSLSASYSDIAQTALNVTWNSIQNIPVNIVSSSTQAVSWSVSSASVSTFANSASFIEWNFIANRPVGLISSSLQATSWSVASASVSVSSSYAATSSRFEGTQLLIRDSTTPPQVDGLLYHDGDEESLAFYNNTSSSIFLGKTIFRLGENATGVTIPKGSAVEYAGTTGGSGRFLIKPAIARPLSVDRSPYMGVVYNDIRPNNIGDVIVIGPITQLNTLGFNAGDALYLSPTVSGGFTNIKPDPQFEQHLIGYVTRVNANNGRISVRDERDIRNLWTEVINKPTGLLSSSVQINQLSNISASFAQQSATASLAVTRSVELVQSASFLSGTVDFPNGIFTPGPVSASLFVGSLSGTLNTRTVRSITSNGTLSQGQSSTGSVSMARGYVLYQISTTQPARVRLYTSQQSRNIDLLRGVGTPPTGNHGVVTDVVTTVGNPTASILPIAYGAVLETPVTTNVAFTITNLEASPVEITANILFLPIE